MLQNSDNRMLFLQFRPTEVSAVSIDKAFAKMQSKGVMISTFTGPSGLSSTLQFVDLSLVSLQECDNAYGPRPITQYCCKGADRKSTCNVSF